MNEAYDVFISFKNLDPDGKPTPDSHLAEMVYKFLASRGLCVFFSSVSLEQLGVSAYKKAIDRGLDSAKVLIAVGMSVENLDSEWVLYEWDSFYNDIISGVKPEGRVFSYLDGIRPSDLPRALRQSQAIIHGPDSLEHLYTFITNAIGVSARQSVQTATHETATVKPADNSSGHSMANSKMQRLLVENNPPSNRQKRLSIRVFLNNIGCSITIVLLLLIGVGIYMLSSRKGSIGPLPDAAAPSERIIRPPVPKAKPNTQAMPPPSKVDEREIQVRISRLEDKMGETVVRTLLPFAQPGTTVVQSTKVSEDGKAVEVVIQVKYETTFGKQAVVLTFLVDKDNLKGLVSLDPRSLRMVTPEDLRRVEHRLQELWRSSTSTSDPVP